MKNRVTIYISADVLKEFKHFCIDADTTMSEMIEQMMKVIFHDRK